MNVQVKIGDQTFDVEVGDLSARPILATVEGETFEVWPEEAAPAAAAAPARTPAPAAAPAPRPAAAGPAVTTESKSKVVQAPIPGAIVSVRVKPGDKVTKGQELISLEAMKMKNAIRAPRDGSIAAVLVNEGDHVQKGHPLVEFTD
jgi:glutaconyl-CoA/methylmalonyl-CoA decarboxylase subunit gamma